MKSEFRACNLVPVNISSRVFIPDWGFLINLQITLNYLMLLNKSFIDAASGEETNDGSTFSPTKFGDWINP